MSFFSSGCSCPHILKQKQVIESKCDFSFFIHHSLILYFALERKYKKEYNPFSKGHDLKLFKNKNFMNHKNNRK